MIDRPFPIGRAATLIPFVRFLDGLGVPVERALERERLPIGLIARPSTYIPTRNNWAFIDRMAREQGIPDLGLRVADAAIARVLSTEMIRGIREAPSLLRAVGFFCRSVHRESSAMSCWLAPRRECLHFGLEKSFGPEVPGYAQTEWLGLMAMIHVVRSFAGPAWLPDEISLRAPGPVPALAYDLFPKSRILTGRPVAYVSLGRALLTTPPAKRQPRPAPSRDVPGLFAEPASKFVGSLRQILPSYLAGGSLGIDGAAKISGTSVRSLQRHLATAGLTWSSLVEDVRVESAMEMLAESDAPSTEIAHATGYTDASNFARAFRRITGMSPSEFRLGGEGARRSSRS